MAGGGSFGNIIFAQLFYFTVDAYGWRGSMLINAGVAMQLFVGAMILREKQPKSGLLWVSFSSPPRSNAPIATPTGQKR